jgi:hypothetical protein
MMATPRRSLQRAGIVPILLAIVAFLPALLPLLIILRDGVNMPYWDQLDPDIANIFIKSHDGTLAWADLVAQHNEHRLLLPRLIYLVIDPITHWNTRVEMIGEWLIMLATSLGLLVLARKTLWRDNVRWFEWQMFWPVLLINLLFFTPAQQENLTLGIGLANVLPFAWIVAGLVAACSRITWAAKLGICIACCAAATWSSGNGMLSWVLVALPLFWPWKQLKQRLGSLAIFAGSAIILVAPYFVGYTTPDHGGAHPQSSSLGKIIPYTLAFLGNPFFWATQFNFVSVAIVTGFLLLVCLAIAIAYLIFRLYRRGGGDPDAAALAGSMLPWLSIAAFAVCNSIMAATSRAGFGTDQALSSRYVIFAIQLPIGLIPLAVLIFADLRRRSASARAARWQAQVAGALVGVLLVVQVLVIPLSMASSEQARLRRRQGKAALLLAPVIPENPLLKQLVHPTSGRVIDEIKKLNDLGMINPPLITEPNILKIAVDPETAKGLIEGGMQNVWQPDKDSIGVSGYAYFIKQRRPVDLVLFTYENQDHEQVIFATMDRIVGRPDLAAAKSDASYMGSGWDARLPLARIPSYFAQTKLSAWALDADTGRIYRLDGELPIKR